MRTEPACAFAAALVLAAGAGSAATPPESFDIHFAIITAHEGAARVATREALATAVERLNATFVDASGAPIARFRLKALITHAQLRDSSCKLVAQGDARDFDSSRAVALFNDCHDSRVRDPRAINAYIYDSGSALLGREDQVGHGRRNGDHPLVFVDWERIASWKQSPLEHEFGHAFGLGHVCAPGATLRSSTNLMASAECGKGSGGLRDLGLDAGQVAVVRANAVRIHRALEGAAAPR